jgi:general secretion pathway protein H
MLSAILGRQDAIAHRTRQGGFTLLELIVVVVILGVMAGTAIPLFSGALGKQKSEGIIQEFVLTLRLANQRSVFRQEKQDFVVDFRKNRYWFETMQRGKYSKKEKMRAVETRELPSRFEFLMVYFPSTDETEERRNARISFYPDGTATETVILIGREDVTGEKDYDYLEVIKLRGTDSNVKVLEGEEKQTYVDLL